MTTIVMRCSACEKPLTKPAATIGRMVLGPKCAKRAGLSLRAAKHAIKTASRHRPAAKCIDQLDLFTEPA